MEFTFTSEEESFRQELRDFLKRELPEDWTGSLEEENDASWRFVLEMRKKLAGKGWLTMAWPEEYGGRGASHVRQLIFAEEMAYHRAPGRDSFATKMLAPVLMIYGTEDQRRHYLPPSLGERFSGARGTRSPGPAPTWPPFRPGRWRTATTSSSVAPRYGLPRPTGPTI